MKRIYVFIDGFNVYHRLDEYVKKTGQNIKWLDYKGLILSMLAPDESLVGISFFTAIDTKRPSDVVARHQNYLGALRATGINIQSGTFKYKQQNCRSCGVGWTRPEEKETDVRIACKILELGIQDTYDECWLVSGDTDYVPLVQTFKTLFTDQKSIKVLIPPNCKMPHDHNPVPAKTYTKGCKIPTHQLGFRTIKDHQLPDTVHNAKGERFTNPYRELPIT